jgi:cytidine deaminase
MAREQAKNSEYKVKIGSVYITRNGEMYTGFNKTNKTHSQSNTPYNRIHAELDVLLKIGLYNKEKIAGGSIFLYREASFGIASCKPCSVCEKILDELKVKNIYYTENDGYWLYSKKRIAEKI